MAMVLPRIKWHGTTAQRMSITAEAGVIGYDTELNQLCVFDGVTLGGRLIQFDTGSSYHPDLFDVKWADHICNDVQWLRADTFSWQSGVVYQEAYQHLVDDIDGKTLQSETIGSTTIQFYLADDGHKICPDTEESNVAAIYNATGVAWYYIIDTTNQRFKLPRINPTREVLEQSAPVISNGDKPSFSNGTDLTNRNLQVNGNSGNGLYLAGTATATTSLLHFGDKSGLIADLSQATGVYKGKQYLYFYVGNFTQTALENTAGLNAELFNGKQDVLTGVSGGGDYVVSYDNSGFTGTNYTNARYYKWKSGRVTQSFTMAARTTITLPVAMNGDYTISHAVRATPGITQAMVTSVFTPTATTLNHNCFATGTYYIDVTIDGFAA